MGKRANLTGQRFGKLTVLEYVPGSKDKKATYRCRCDCGNETFVMTNHLTTGHRKSCGCISAGRTMGAKDKIPRKSRGSDACYNVFCASRNNYRESSAWSCSRCHRCEERKTERVGAPALIAI